MLVHHLQNALRAKELYKRDVAYVVTDGEVKIVDEFTGRVLEGRRYSEGLHQAIEAKEGVRIKEENQTLATITIQNYFKMYDKLVGHDRVRPRPSSPSSRRPTRSASSRSRRTARMIRDDQQDLIYKNEESKWNARRRRHRRAQRGRAADPGRHRLDREVRAALRRAEPARGPAPRAEREEPREGSDDRGPGRPQGRGHGRHEHGRPRRRHPARRQPRVPGAPGDGGPRLGQRPRTCCSRWTRRSAPAYEADYEPIFAEVQGADGRRARRGRRAGRALRAGHRAARVSPHRQPAPRPVRPPGRPRRVAVLPVARGRPDADVRLATASPRSWSG